MIEISCFQPIDWEVREQEVRDRIDEIIEEHNPRFLVSCFSGGHDSLAATLACTTHPQVNDVLHINTGIGIPETREFVRRTCEEQGWELHEYHPPDKTYEELVKEYGFPGPGAHTMMYRYLKERAIRKATQDFKEEWLDRVIFLTGVRTQESARRKMNVEPRQREGARVWGAPIHDWTKADCRRYIAYRGVDTNPVVDFLHMSGECLCGAFAKPGELEEIRLWYPHVAEKIEALQKEVKACGKHAVWGTRPPRGRKGGSEAGPMCTDCPSRSEFESEGAEA